MERPTTPHPHTPSIRPEYWALLTDAQYPKRGNPFWRIVWMVRALELWLAHREEVLADWIVRRPGSRPSTWWRFDMPFAQRLRLGGQGTHRSTVLWCGIPRWWSLAGFSHTDPPVFESQAAFLLRLKLLLPDEMQHLDRLNLLPEFLPKEWWPTPDA
jgi:hypothetical protein